MKLNSRVILNILVISIIFLLFVLWHQLFIIDAQPTSSISMIKHFKVYLITTDKEYQYWKYMDNGASDMATATGINYIWDAPAVRNVQKQIEVIQGAIDNDANAILIAADDPKEVAGVVEDAKAKGIKIIYVDSPAYEEAITTLATDNYQAGLAAGQAMLTVLDNMNITGGSIGIISIAAKSNSELREMGFRAVLEQDGRFHLLNTVYTNGNPDEAQSAAEQTISENEDLIALFGTNEGTSVGVGNAIKANSNRFVGVGFDKTDVMLQLLHDGNLKAIVAQNPYTMGYLGVAEAIAAILGKDTGPEFMNTGVSILYH